MAEAKSVDLPPMPQAEAPRTPSSIQNDFDGPQLRIIQPESGAPAFQSKTAAPPDAGGEASHQSFRPISNKPSPPPEKPKTSLFLRIFIPASIAMLCLFLAAVVGFRTEIAKRAPGLLAFYNMIGFNPLPAGGGIVFQNVRDDSRFEELDNALVIHGTLVNQTPAKLKVPLFKMDITSSAGQTKTFMARGPIEEIEGGASVPFTLERTGFAVRDWDVRLTFGNGTEKDTGKPLQSIDTPKPTGHEEKK